MWTPEGNSGPFASGSFNFGPLAAPRGRVVPSPTSEALVPQMASIPFAEGRSGAVLAEARVLNLTPPSKIGSGICFLDHMLDQLTSHAQLGVTMRCGVLDKDSPQPRSEKDCFAPLKDYATGLSSRTHDEDIFVACGTALGLALKRVVDEVPSQGRYEVAPRLRPAGAPEASSSQRQIVTQAAPSFGQPRPISRLGHSRPLVSTHRWRGGLPPPRRHPTLHP